MVFSEFVLSVAASILANPVYLKMGLFADKKKIRDRINQFIDAQKELNGEYSIDEEYDYEGLLVYFKKDLIKDIEAYLRAPYDKEETIKNSILQKAESSEFANTNTPKAKAKLKRIIDTTIGIIREYYRESVPIGFQILANEITERFERTNASHAFNLVSFIDARKEITLNQPLFPWFRDSILYRNAFEENMFIEPCFEEPVAFSDLHNYKNTYLAFLGPAGAGKSTLLMYIFAFSVIKDTHVVYLTAKEADRERDLLKQIDAYPLSNENKHLLLIDSVDEAFFNDYAHYEDFIRLLKMLTNCSIWLGCRTDFYSTYYDSNTALAEKAFQLMPWNEEQYNLFIDGYSKICKDNKLHEKIDGILGNRPEYQEMKENPFQLALIVYLAADPDPDIHLVSGVYDLYERFLRLWIKREKRRGSSNSSEQEIMQSLRDAAYAIYTQSEWKLDGVALQNSAVSCLLTVSGSDTFDAPIANAFYHRSLAAFILAQNIIECFQAGDKKTAEKLLSTKLKDDVTNFVGDKFRCLDDEVRNTIKVNLEKMYTEHKEDESYLSYHEQIIYFITRMGLNVDDFLMRIISSNPTNLIMRLTLAYGCVLSNNVTIRKYALDYAKSIAQGSDDAKTNRGWTVVYFGDVNDRDPYTYLDDEKRPWAKARKARIARFTKKKPRVKDVRFWLFDIPLFHSFLEDRDWNDISKEEYSIIKKLNISTEYFNEQEIAFLTNEKEILLKRYAEHLQSYY